MDNTKIEAWIEENKSNYSSKYKFRSVFKKNDNVFKFHYYMRDSQLVELNLFFEINIENDLKYKFTEAIHDYEQRTLLVDALKRVIEIRYTSTLTVREIKECLITNHIGKCNPSDIKVLLYYIEYHHGINQKAIDMFYSIYLNHFDELIQEGNYNECIAEFVEIMHTILYEDMWIGTIQNFLDQQYYLHLYYIRVLLNEMLQRIHMNVFTSKHSIEKLVKEIYAYPRFTLCLVSALDTDSIREDIKIILMNIIFYSLPEDIKGRNLLPLVYLKCVYYHKKDEILTRVEEIFKELTYDITVLQNHDMQIALGVYFLEKYGYDILLNTFELDYNLNLFRAFDVKEIPEVYHKRIQKELIDAFNYYRELMMYDDTKLHALEMIMIINQIILENFKDEMYKE